MSVIILNYYFFCVKLALNQKTYIKYFSKKSEYTYQNSWATLKSPSEQSKMSNVFVYLQYEIKI